MEEKDIEYIPLDKGGEIESPSWYHDSNKQLNEYPSEGFEVPENQMSKVGASSDYEAVGSDRSELPKTLHKPAEIGGNIVTDPAGRETGNYKHDENYDDIEQYTGVYINVPTNRKTTTPSSIKVSEFQEFMKRHRRTVIQDIVKEFMTLPRGRQHTCSEVIQHERSSDIIPYDHSRVRLQVGRDTTQSDYYNASIVKGSQGKGMFIAAKEPQSRRLAEDFWRMIWQHDIRNVVMLTDNSDAEVSYWPKKVTTNEVFGEMTVILQESTIQETYTTRKLKAFTNNDDKILTVHQHQFHDWSHGGVPEDSTNLINFINRVKLSQEKKKMTPLLVHCRNGSGVTGTFIALYKLMDVLKDNNTISVFNVVRNMRKDRMDMVLTRVQYLYIYETLQQAQLTPETSATLADDVKGMDDQSLQKKADQEYAALRKIQELSKQSLSQMGDAHENAHKNRFRNIIPLDDYIPILKSKGVTLGSNGYINATKLQLYKSLLKSSEKHLSTAEDVPVGMSISHMSPKDDGSIILTQDPLASIVEDFWRLVYDYKSGTIIMLNELNEVDRTPVKYWPDAGRITCGSITIKCINTSSEDHFRIQQFEVTHQDHQEPIIVKHITFDVLKRDDDILANMVDFIKFTGHISSGHTVIHCLNGVGLSAVYVIVKAQLECLEKEGVCDIYVAVQRLRKKHTNFMSTKDDYTLCLKLLRSYLKNQDDYAVIY